jgi:hypothetical protein
MSTTTVAHSTFCPCAGREHIVCRPGWKPAYLPAPYKAIAPWLADYDARKPNYQARRAAAVKLGLTVRPPSGECACQGAEHLVCLPERKWRAVLAVKAPHDRPDICRCQRESRTYHSRWSPHGAGSLNRHGHSRACRVLAIAERRRHWQDGEETPVKPSIVRRLLRLWLAVVRESWTPVPTPGRGEA